MLIYITYGTVTVTSSPEYWGDPKDTDGITPLGG